MSKRQKGPGRRDRAGTNPRPVLAGLATVPLAVALSNSMLIPVLPLIARSLDISHFQASLLLTALSLPSAVLLPVAGYLSDKYGRRQFLVGGLIIYALGGLAAGLAGLIDTGAAALNHLAGLQALATTATAETSTGLAALPGLPAKGGNGPLLWLLAGRVVQGVGTAGTTLIAYTMVGDMFRGDDRQQYLGFLEGVYSIGKWLAPLIGSGLSLLAWWAPFWAYLPMGLMAALLVWRLVPESHPDDRRQLTTSAYRRRLRQLWRRQGGNLAVELVSGAAIIALWFGALVLVGVRLSELGVRGFQRGLLVSLPVVLFALTAWAGPTLATALALKFRAALGFALITVACGASLMIHYTAGGMSLLSLLVVACAVGVGTGLAVPALNVLVAGGVEEQERGIITGLYGTARSLGAAAGPPLFSALSQSQRAAAGLPWLAMAAMALVSALLCALAVKKAAPRKVIS